MSVRAWWKRKSTKGTLVTAVNVLIGLEIILLLSVPVTAPWYESKFGPSHDPYFPIGQEMWLIIICIFTFVFRFLIKELARAGMIDSEKDDPNDAGK